MAEELTDRIVITHPDLGESIVIRSSLPVWQERGWSPKQLKEDETVPSTESKFDAFPADANVSEPPAAVEEEVPSDTGVNSNPFNTL